MEPSRPNYTKIILFEGSLKSYTPDVVSAQNANTRALTSFKSTPLFQYSRTLESKGAMHIAQPKIGTRAETVPLGDYVAKTVMQSYVQDKSNSLTNANSNHETSLRNRESMFKAEIKEFLSEESRGRFWNSAIEAERIRWHKNMDDQLFRNKAKEFDKSIDEIKDVFRALINPNTKSAHQLRLKFLKLSVPEKKLNKKLLDIKSRLSDMVFDKKTGAPRQLNAKQIEEIKKKFEAFLSAAESWRETSLSTLQKEITKPSTIDGRHLKNQSFLKKIESNKTNLDLAKVLDLCTKNDFEGAHKVVADYRAKVKSQKAYKDEKYAFELMDGLYKEKFNEQYDSFGVDKRYMYDPLYQRVTSKLEVSDIPNNKINDYIAKTINERESFMKEFSIDNLPENQNIVDRVNELLKTVGQDEAAKYVIDYFRNHRKSVNEIAFHNEWCTKEGLPKFCKFPQSVGNLHLLDAITMPAHAEDRELLYHLCMIDRSTVEGKAAFNQGLGYLQKSLSVDRNALCYRALTRGVIYAAKFKETSEALLKCKNLLPSLTNAEQLKTFEQILPLIAEVTETLYNPHSSLEQRLKAEKLLLDLDAKIEILQKDFSQKIENMLKPITDLVENNAALQDKYVQQKMVTTTEIPSFKELHERGVRDIPRYFEKKQISPSTGNIVVFSNHFSEPNTMGHTESIPLVRQDFVMTGKENIEISQNNLKIDPRILKEIISDGNLNKEVDKVLGTLKSPEPLISGSYFQARHDVFDKAMLDVIDCIEEWQMKIGNEPWYTGRNDKIILSEVLRKSIQLGYDVRHPIQSAYQMAHGTAQLISGIERFMFDSSRHDMQALKNIWNAPSHEKLKMIVGVLFDGIVFHKFGQACSAIKSELSVARNEVKAISSLGEIVSDVKKLEQMTALGNLLSEEIQVLGAFEKTNILVKDLSEGQKLQEFEKLKNVLVQIAEKKDLELFKLNTQLPRTLELVKNDLARRIAILEMKYDKATVEEALSLFNTNDFALVENIKMADYLEYVAHSLNKINSNDRWKNFKYDSAHNNSTYLKNIEEAMSGIVCEERGILGTLLRSPNMGEEFIERIGTLEKCWDVKTARKYTLNGRNIFNPESFVHSIKNGLIGEENIIVNVSYLDNDDLARLYEAMRHQICKDDFSRLVIVNTIDVSQSLNSTQLIKCLGF